MLRESGNRNSSIWLIADSSPPRWADHLDEPLDSRHPARHNIWTPVFEGIQRHVYLEGRRRVDDTDLYVRNAVHRAEDNPYDNATEWGPTLLEETNEFGTLLDECNPTLAFTFGAFAFEFARRSRRWGPGRSIRYWSTTRLGAEFNRSVTEFDPEEVNVVPLLHVSIARGHFLKSHENFTGESSGNYFDYVAREIGELLLGHKDTLNIWVRP